MSDYKPGDVALVGGRDGDKVRAIWQGNQWATQNGRYLNDWQVETRPLVVVDPEDREQVERLTLAYLDAANTSEATRAWFDEQGSADQMQAALRSLIAPPRPEEPTGRFAAVLDRDGDEWVRLADATVIDGWLRVGGLPINGKWTHYSDIAAVKVLSEGVQP